MAKLTKTQHIRLDESVYSRVVDYCNSTESNLSVQDFIREAVAEKLAKVTSGIPDYPTSRQQLRDLALLLMNSI
jgi:hypothetical protein